MGETWWYVTGAVLGAVAVVLFSVGMNRRYPLAGGMDEFGAICMAIVWVNCVVLGPVTALVCVAALYGYRKELGLRAPDA